MRNESKLKTAQKMAQVKEWGGGGEERKDTLSLWTNPRILKTTHLACHA